MSESTSVFMTSSVPFARKAENNNDCLNGKARSDYQQKLCTGCLSGKYAVHQFFPQEHHACDNV